ncbi:MAG TPA: M57 family metalloprotease [Chitinophagaceae bacterium]|nr:M57 family metalloprotease [Chitinophagaceae bacterium]
MQKMFKTLAIIGIASLTIIGCKKNDIQTPQEEISQQTLNKIYNQGFGISNVQKIDEGYLVEGDIVLTEEFLNSNTGGNSLRIANNEQYRTTNLVNGPRVITIALDSKLAARVGYPEALAEVARRYNAENLTLTFQVVSSGANITYVEGHGQYLASAGFPTGGNPYNTVKVNAQSIGEGNTSTFINFCATILAHEGGHCIGFRHTDYMDRSYSCGGAYSNEGASNVGAILIPGTPSGPDAGSWMLACVSRNQNRPFNANDKTALTYLY